MPKNNKHLASTAPTRSSSPDPLALLWPRMLVLFTDRRDAMFAMLTSHGLTPPHAHALAVLSEGPIRMRDMADQMMCDASYITSIVDRLEDAGLAERRLNPTDRRVKEIALTEQGNGAAHDIRLVMAELPAQFRRLSKAEKAQLAALLERLVPETDGLADPFRPIPKGKHVHG